MDLEISGKLMRTNTKNINEIQEKLNSKYNFYND